jgi:hypothetical protein
MILTYLKHTLYVRNQGFSTDFDKPYFAILLNGISYICFSVVFPFVTFYDAIRISEYRVLIFSIIKMYHEIGTDE